MLSNNDITRALSTLSAPQGAGNIIDAGMVSGLSVTADGQVRFLITVPPDMPKDQIDALQHQAQKIVSDLDHVQNVMVLMTAEKSAGAPPTTTPPTGAQPDPHGMNKNPPLDLPIKKIIVVASGKGGVGKSTIAFNLGRYFAAQGLNVGVLDADIYGPSLPKLSGWNGEKPETNTAGKLIPHRTENLRLMSIGYLVDNAQALIWRGPMIQSALYQMLRDVDWTDGLNAGEMLDILVIDLPPGTGDVQLTLAQKIAVDGAVIVSTPQDLALIDAAKAIEMFRKTDVPILGVIENMSQFICPKCGHAEDIFGAGGAEKQAKELGVNFLGALGLELDIRRKSDAGEPIDLNLFDPVFKYLKNLSV